MSWDCVTRNFESVHNNHDETIQNDELRNFIPTREEATPMHNLYGAPAAASSLINDAPIRTSSSEETRRYVQDAAGKIYWSSNPKIIQRPDGGSVKSEQQITLKCLQPPALPEPQPNVIIEKRPPQPPPPPTVVIHEREEQLSSSQPLIFRERPPSRPDAGPGKESEQWLPPVPAPPSSLVVERFPAMEKPRDIIIERWLPYGPFPERRTIVRRAPPPIEYPNPTHTLIIHGKGSVVFVDKFQCLGVAQEDPDAYISRYGSSLLDSRTLVEAVRRAGVTANITCPCDTTPYPPPDQGDPPPPKDCYCAIHGYNCPKMRQASRSQPINSGNGEASYDYGAN